MDKEKELLLISEELQIEFIKAMETALLKIQDKRVGGKKAQRVISHSLLYCWTLWLQQLSKSKRAELFEEGLQIASDKLLDLAKAEIYGEGIDLKQ